MENSRKIGVVFTIVLTWFSVYGLAAQDPNFHIYLCFGQSNMQGVATPQAADKTVVSRFKTFQAIDCANLGRTKQRWYDAVPPTCQCYSGLSPADYFGRTLAANTPDSMTIGIINVAVAGSDIRLFDKDLYTSYDSTITDSWFTSIVKGYNGNPYQYLIDLAKLAQQDGVIKGVLLHQGETNTGDTKWPTYVQKIYNNMLQDLGLEASAVPLLAGELLATTGNCCSSMNAIINTLPTVVPTAHIISSSGCTGQDAAHFDAPGYRKLGTRYAEKMLALNYDVETITSLDEGAEGYALKQNYPNPASKGNTIIAFTIPKASYVSLKIVDALGNEVVELAGKVFRAGEHIVAYDLTKLSRGVYFYRLKTDNYSATKKLIVSIE